MIDGIPSNGWRSMNLLTKDLSRSVDMDKMASWASIGGIVTVTALVLTMLLGIYDIIVNWHHAPTSTIVVKSYVAPKQGGIEEGSTAPLKSEEYNQDSIYH